MLLNRGTIASWVQQFGGLAGGHLVSMVLTHIIPVVSPRGDSLKVAPHPLSKCPPRRYCSWGVGAGGIFFFGDLQGIFQP